MHGKTSAVEHRGVGVFAGLPSPLTAHNSLPRIKAITWPSSESLTSLTSTASARNTLG